MEARGSSSYVVQRLGDMVECPICIGILTKPKTLPSCMHTFCLPCLETYAKGKQPGDHMPCPVCRTSFTVASGGFKSLPRNHLMENIVELHRISQPEKRSSSCDNCNKGFPSGSVAGDEENGGFKVDMYCVECRLKLCTRCVEVHRRLKLTSNHKMVNLGKDMSLSRSDEAPRKQIISCSQHPSKSAHHFCQTCSKPLCKACASQHKSHDIGDISHRMKRLRREIRMDVSAIKKSMTEIQRRMDNLDREKTRFTTDLRQIEEQVNNRSEYVIGFVRAQKERLLQQLEALKTERLKEIGACHQEMESTVCMLESVKAFSMEVGKRDDAQLLRLANEIRSQVHELLRTKQRQLNQVEVRLSDGGRSATDARNAAGGYLGELTIVNRKKNVLDSYLAVPDLIDTISGSQCVTGLTVLDYKLYLVYSGSHDLFIYHTEPVIKMSNRVVLPGSDPQDLASCPKNQCIYVCDWGSRALARLSPNGMAINVWETKENPGGLCVTEQGNLLVSYPNSRQLQEFNPEGTVVRSIPLTKDLDKPLHAVQLRTSGRLAVSCLHRIGITEETGSVVQLHGGTQGSQVAQVNCPLHMAVDEDDVVFVADTDNNRVKMLCLSSSVECRELTMSPQLIKRPRRLHLDLVTRLLYVGVNDGNVLIYRIVA